MVGRAQVNGLELEYEVLGDDDDPALLMIMGLGAQMIAWDDELCEEFVACGYRVIRYDNRDVGLSTKLHDAGVPDVEEVIRRHTSPPYSLDDMADDAAGLLDALDVDAAHVVGASMGGMVAQLLAIRHPQRVRSLTSVMSTTGAPDVPPPTPEALHVLMQVPPKDREGRIEHAVGVTRTLAGPGFPFDEERARRRATESVDRCFYPQGVARQLAAVLSAPSRVEALGAVTAPTLVVHGTDDPLVPLGGGESTAAAVPGAELVVIPGMAHDLPLPVWPEVVGAIRELTARAGVTA